MTRAVRAQLRDFGLAAMAAIVIVSVAFVVVRNRELSERQIGVATRSADALLSWATVLPSTHAAIVIESRASSRYSFLRRWQVNEGASWRVLGGPAHGSDDKLIYDAANRATRDGNIAEMLPDGSGRALVARATTVLDRATAAAPGRKADVIVGMTGPAAPAPYPWLVIIGVLGLGASIAAAAGLVGRRAAPAGTFAGLLTLAVPALLWHAWIAAGLIIAIGAAVALAQQRGVTDRIALGYVQHRTAYGFLAPAALAMFVLVAAPFVIGIAIGFYDHHHGSWSFVGVDNFVEILSGGGRPLNDPLNFWFILGVTVLWTIANIVLHVTIGVALALLLSRKWIAGRGIFRMLLILPWAIPNYITALMWKGMFEGEYGAINSLLHLAGLDGMSWMTSWSTAFSANVITNTWLGFPFMMVVALGALETIPRELYEAAEVDGASAWQRFRHITLPHLRPALGPAVALGSIWTFNMFNVIYLVSAGQPGNSTNILVTDAYRWAFERGDRYGMAAAYATLIFLVLLLWTVFGRRILRSKEAA
jgi:ABC-type sugar transport system permease subunit